MDTITDRPFSELLRTATRDRHAEAESSGFLSSMLGGGLGLEAYARYTEQLWFVYRALEEPVPALRDDPVAGPFLHPGLMRLPALERDLAHLRGPGGRAGRPPLPAVEEYAARITECAHEWPAGYVAHHYTRYLGDLSGGQVVRGAAERTWGFARKGDGVRFYVFDAVPNPAALKRDYRARLDALPVGDAEKRRVVEECRRAFVCNTALLRDLEREFAATP
ncbi:biliverdin-producing heme oxygenase [Streptomyces sp. MJP52]|uniref:biliverdin-producing heme oxygenase n=1 Tax=Streptomyces sp. MJP52 TaxID=2940555 RepID=UPI002475AF36|nr:biliverdin-producing heme oxygenase [Streptomyces sp. MJP52]MDH6227287.1 heme oxygenase [Streptomyces sp. MJP52]